MKNINITFTYVRSVSINSQMTFFNFSASLSCLLGVRTCECELTTLPVGLDLRVSLGERQIPVTCSAVFSKFSISNEFVRDVCLLLSK